MDYPLFLFSVYLHDCNLNYIRLTYTVCIFVTEKQHTEQ